MTKNTNSPDLDELEQRTSSLGVSANLAQAGKEYVRTFLFSMKADSPVARTHVLTRVFLALGGSIAVFIMFRANHLDPVGIVVIGALAILEMYFAGILSWVIRVYVPLLLIMMGSMSLSWLIFNPQPGRYILINWRVYSGTVTISLAVWEAVFVAVVVLYWEIRRGTTYGILLGSVAAWLVNHFVSSASLILVQFPLFHALRLFISDQTLLIAGTKVLGFGVMGLLVLGLAAIMRGTEIVGVLNQIKLPFKASFFVSLALRSFSTAVEDYDTIRQAELARGSGFHKKTVFGQVKDFGLMAVPLIGMSLTRSTQMAAALHARGFGRATHPTPYREIKPFRWEDIVAIGLSVAIPLALLFTGFNFTHSLFSLWRAAL